MTPLGEKVREQRRARGMTQLQVAIRGEFGHATLVALESGRRRYASAKDVELLARGLDVPEDELWKPIPGGKSDQRCMATVRR